MAEKLAELDKDLSGIATHNFQEEYIRKTLIAHGFFTHAKLLEDHKKQLKEKEREALKLPGGISEEEKRRTTQLVYHYKEGKEFHSLREPLNLQKRRFLSSKALAKWPEEIPCLDHRTQFIYDHPSLPEPLYKQETPVISPKIRSAYGEGTVIYNNSSRPQKFFTHSRCGPSTPEPHPRQRRASNDSLIFESRFESGNLAKAIRVGRWDYELYLNCDLYTQKHTQWFFFSVQNMRAGQTYRFTIVNLYKPSSLYNDGMQPVMHSEKRALVHGTGWRRVGFNIKYFKTNIRRADTKTETSNYGLTWSYTFLYDNDTCYFAHCYPYTYTDLQEYLHGIAKDPIKSKFCKQRTLCQSIAGNLVPLLTITSPLDSPTEAQSKRTVVVSARIHPGETNGSWMMKGLLDFLVSNAPDAQVLRDVFVFKIIPMLNPDGVIVGNYRCSLSGRDLNRNYKSQLKEAYPTVWHTKELVRQLMKEREVVVYCDFHGHSRKQNVFIYGCDKIQDPSLRLRSRVFPKMLALNAPSKFSYKGCNFKVQKSKEGTGRVFMWKEIGVINSYTMEATFCGSNLGNSQGFHFSTKELEHMGYHFCDTLLDYCDPDQTKVDYILNQLTEEYRQALVDKLTSLGVTIPDGVDPLDVEFDSDILSGIDSSDNGSDSSESDGPPVHMMNKLEKKKRNKKLQTRKERNKRKAQLKLTHQQLQQSPLHTMKTEAVPPPVPAQNNNSEKKNDHPADSSSSGAPANGGIPKFIQERIDERQRKDSLSSINRISDDSHDATMPEYVEMVAADYMRNGLPLNVTLEANKELRLSTASLIPPPKDCPMAISSVVLHQPSLSKISSKSTLPGMPPSTNNDAIGSNMAGSRGAFTSSYVVNHLKDAGTSDDLEKIAQVHTRNLMSLSKLFRTLKPHLISSANRPTSATAQKLSTQEEVRNESPTLSKVTSATSTTPLPKIEYIAFNGNPIPQREFPNITSVPKQSSTSGDLVKSLSQSLPLDVPKSKDNSSTQSVTTTQETKFPVPKGNLTCSDQNTITTSLNSTTSHTMSSVLSRENSKSNSPMKGLECPSSSRLKEEPSLLHLVQPPTTLLELCQDQKRPNIKQETERVHVPSSNVSKPSSIVSDQDGSIARLKATRKRTDPREVGSIEHHKQQIAVAVESIQNKKKLFRENKNHSNVVRPHTSSSFPPVMRRSQDIIDYPQTTTVREIHTSEGSRQKVKLKSRRHEEDTPPQWRVYTSSSNPLIQNMAKYSEKGITPATVSLMLPGTMQSSTTSSPPSYNHTKLLHTRYYSNYKRGL